MSHKIFINYRREDSIGTAGRLRDRLAEAFGEENLFMDVDNIPAGVDFVADLNSQVAACRVFLAVIGPNWLDAKDESGVRRLDNPDDFVTIEIAAALARDIRVIPVLVDNARMPRADKLPEPIRPLVRRNAFELRNTQFRRDAETLVARMREALVPRRRGALGENKPGRWRVGAIAGVAAVAVLLLIGWGGYAFIQKIVVTAGPTVQQQREVEFKAKSDHQATVQAAEAKRKADEDRQRLADLKAEGKQNSGISKGSVWDSDIAIQSDAIRLNPNDADAFHWRGIYYSNKDDYDRAIADFSEAIRLRPNAVDFSLRGMAYLNKKNYFLAINDYSEAIRLDPNRAAAAYCSRGRAKRGINDPSAAADIVKAFELDRNINCR